MGLFGSIAGLFTGAKVFDAIHDESDGIVNTVVDAAVGVTVGTIVENVVDEFEDFIDDDEF